MSGRGRGMTNSADELIAEVERLDKIAEPGPWANKPSEWRLQDGEWRYQDDYDNWTSCIRPDPDSPVENTLAEFWGSGFDDEANAECAAFYRSAAPELAQLLKKARLALQTIANFPVTHGDNHDAVNMRMIATKAFES